MSETTHTVISKSTKVTVGAVAAIVSVLAAVLFYIDTKMGERFSLIDRTMKDTVSEVHKLALAVERLSVVEEGHMQLIRAEISELRRRIEVLEGR